MPIELGLCLDAEENKLTPVVVGPENSEGFEDNPPNISPEEGANTPEAVDP